MIETYRVLRFASALALLYAITSFGDRLVDHIKSLDYADPETAAVL